MPSSKRLFQEYCVLLSTVLCVVKLPLPSLPEPFHTAVALRFIDIFFMSSKDSSKWLACKCIYVIFISRIVNQDLQIRIHSIADDQIYSTRKMGVPKYTTSASVVNSRILK